MTVIRIKDTAVYIDQVDADLDRHRWHLTASGYAARNSPRPNRVTIRMHRVIMARILGRSLEPGEQVDHIDGDKLNNRRDNLRLATVAQNAFNRGRPAHNTTGYKGVYRNSVGNLKPYQAAITIDGRKIYLGSYHDPRDAARAYDRAAHRVAGPFARGNHS